MCHFEERRHCVIRSCKSSFNPTLKIMTSFLAERLHTPLFTSCGENFDDQVTKKAKGMCKITFSQNTN